MECTDPRIGTMLPDYQTGHLGAEDHAAVERHLATCEDCRESLRLMRALSGQPPDGTMAEDAHPAWQVLAEYYGNRDALGAHSARRIADHLKSCAQCAGDINSLTGLEADLQRTARDSHAPAPAPLMARRFLAALLRPTVLIPISVGLVAVVGALLLQSRKPSLEPIPTFQIAAVTRGQSQPTVVTRHTEEQSFRLAVPYRARSQDRDYGFFVASPDNLRPVASLSDPDFRDSGKISVLLDARALRDGVYAVLILEVTKTPPIDTVKTAFPFQLKTAH